MKLTDQILKKADRITELIRQLVNIDEMQFGFMPGCLTTNTIFILRQLQEKYLRKKKKLYSIFVNLEKAFDRVPRDVVWWALRKLGVEKWLVKIAPTTLTRPNITYFEEKNSRPDF